MNGTDPLQAAHNLVTYLGGAAGGYLVAAAFLITLLLSMGHLCERGRIVWVTIFGAMAWGTAFLLNTLLGIAA